MAHTTDFMSTTTTTSKCVSIIVRCKLLVWTFLDVTHFSFTLFPVFFLFTAPSLSLTSQAHYNPLSCISQDLVSGLHKLFADKGTGKPKRKANSSCCNSGNSYGKRKKTFALQKGEKVYKLLESESQRLLQLKEKKEKNVEILQELSHFSL